MAADVFTQLLERVRTLETRLNAVVLPEVGSTSAGFAWTGSAITAAQTVLADGTLGDVVTVMYAVAEEVGADTGGGVATLEPGDSFNVVTDGTNICTLSCTAGGGLTIARSAGADSYTASLWAVYV